MEHSKEAAVFEFEDVSLSFGSLEALSDVSFTLGAGESLALIGPSGSGKTSLLRLCVNVLKPSSGHVRCRGCDYANTSASAIRELRSQIGFISQDFALVPNLSALQNVLAGRLGSRSFLASLRDLIKPKRSDVEEVYETLRSVGIEDKIFQKVFRLSGGEQQRVAIARALYQKPFALLADEPVASVDPARANANMELLTEVCRERNLSLLVSMHDLALAKFHFSRLLGLRNGRLLFDAPTSSIDETKVTQLYQLDTERGANG